MKQRLKSYLAKPLAIVGAFPTKMSQRDEIQALVKRLHPRLGGKALIRLGSQTDGGYLVPDDLLGISACFSPGVDAESGFEKDCAELGMNVFLADKSVDGPAVEHPLFSFEKKFLGTVTNNDFMTLDNWVSSSTPEDGSDLLLQMDIEGHEYAVLLATSETLMKRFRIIVAEFHHLDCFWSEPFFRIARSAFDKILQTHTCVHLHPNNFSGSIQKGGLDIPRLMEFTFLRNDHIKDFSYQENFPHPLDRDNDSTLATLTLPKCWYGNK
jgi:Methyltransferase FkbM domain